MPFRLRGTPAWFFSIPAGTPQDWLPSLRDSRNFFQLCPHSISAGFPRRDSRHPHFCAHFYSELHTILRPDWLYRPPEYKQAQSESSQDAPDLCWLSSLCTFCFLFFCLLFGSLVFHAFLLSASTFFCIFFCIILAFLSAFFSVTSFVCYLESTSIFLCGEAVITHACPALRFLPGWFELRCSFVGTRIISLNEGDAACESLIDGLVTGDKATAILILGGWFWCLGHRRRIHWQLQPRCNSSIGCKSGLVSARSVTATPKAVEAYYVSTLQTAFMKSLFRNWFTISHYLRPTF